MHLVPGHTAMLRYRSQPFQDVLTRLRQEKMVPGGTVVTLHGGSRTALREAASTLASSLNRSLYRVDLAAVVSKYIGETEKNLAMLFARAESKNWILFFDEADALMGARTDVKDSHDRYANLDTAYLLDRMEGFGGIAILTTNRPPPPAPAPAAARRRLRHIWVKFPPD